MTAQLLEPRTVGDVEIEGLTTVAFENEPSGQEGMPSMCVTSCVSWVTWTCDSTTFCGSVSL